MNKAEEKKSDSAQQKGQVDVYNPKKIPTYLGIFAKKDIAKDIEKHVKLVIETLRNKYPDDKVLLECFDTRNPNKLSFSPIKDPHVTTLFIGANHNVTKSEYYTTFQEDLDMDVDICAIAIVPGKIVTGICFPDQSRIKVENKFPHVTMMKGSWQPKQSNDLLEALCDEGGPLHQEWKNRDLEKLEDGYAEKFEINQSKTKFVAYVVRPVKFIMSSTTRGFG